MGFAICTIGALMTIIAHFLEINLDNPSESTLAITSFLHKAGSAIVLVRICLTIFF